MLTELTITVLGYYYITCYGEGKYHENLCAWKFFLIFSKVSKACQPVLELNCNGYIMSLIAHKKCVCGIKINLLILLIILLKIKLG